MREILKRVKSFIIFDSPLDSYYIRKHFITTHNRFQENSPYWSLNATRKKAIANFWFRHVLLHYAFIIIVPLLFVILLGNKWHSLVFSIFLAGSISFVTLFAFNYWPTYFSDFLPKLDTIMAEHEKRISDEDQMKKCKRSQYSIPALTIIFYVFSKIGSIPLPACNDHSAKLLNNLYGADKDKLKQNLSRLYKLSNLSPKERAEIQKGITTAQTFFKALDYSPAQQILNQLEVKLQRAEIFFPKFSANSKCT
jgi:hypothetical protein